METADTPTEIQGEWCAHNGPSHFLPRTENHLSAPICGAVLEAITMTCFRPPAPRPCPLCLQIVERENEPEGVLIRSVLGINRINASPEVEKLAAHLVAFRHRLENHLKDIRQRVERLGREPYPD